MDAYLADLLAQARERQAMERRDPWWTGNPATAPEPTVDDLPVGLRIRHLAWLSPYLEQHLGMELVDGTLFYGVLVYTCFGMFPRHAREHQHAKLLMSPCWNLPIAPAWAVPTPVTVRTVIHLTNARSAS